VFKRNKVEWLPWYRRKQYRGNLTEAEKRQLDDFRASEMHPATDPATLPEDVRSYINRIEFESYDRKGDLLLSGTLIYTAIGVGLCVLAYYGHSYFGSLSYVLAVALVIASWVRQRVLWKGLSEEFLPSEDSGIPNQTDEGIITEWEQSYIVESRRAARENSNHPIK